MLNPSIDEKIRVDDKQLKAEDDNDSPIKRLAESDDFSIIDEEDDVAILSTEVDSETLEIIGNFELDGDTLTINEFGLNMLDYGARFYSPAEGRWFTVDALSELYYSTSPYAYALNNPVIYIDPDGNAVEKCCEELQGFLAGITDNAFGTNLRSRGNTSGFRDGVNTANGVSLAAATILLIDGTASTAAGTGGLAASGVAAATGVGAPVGGVGAAASGALVAKGAAELVVGGVLLSNTLDNIKADNQSGNRGSSSERTSNDALRTDKNGRKIPDPEAEGTSHTQLGTRKSKRSGNHRQAREFNSKNQEVRDIDFTDHNRPKNHTNPHQHEFSGNGTGNRQRGGAKPLEENK